jgi:hypothetical protein
MLTSIRFERCHTLSATSKNTSASECLTVQGAAFIAALMGYGKIRSALESSAGGKVNPRFLAAVLLRVK